MGRTRLKVIKNNVVSSLEDQLELAFLGQYEAGDTPPSERELAGNYEVSRYEVRMALQRLEHRGLIAIRPGSRATLNSSVDVATKALTHLRQFLPTIDEVYEARVVVEGGAVAALASRVKEKQFKATKLKDLDDKLAEIDSLAHLTGMAVARRRRDCDLEFHLALVEAVGNALLSGVQRSLLVPLQVHAILWVDLVQVEQWQREHRAIVSRVRAGQASVAQRAVATHLRGAVPPREPHPGNVQRWCQTGVAMSSRCATANPEVNEAYSKVPRPQACWLVKTSFRSREGTFE